MKISSAFPSTYLKASDLQQRRVRVTMGHVAMEDLGGDLKPILYFQGKEKGLVLNKTNSNAIMAVYGDDTDQWLGQSIELYEAQVDFQGRTVAAIRVFVPRQVAAQVAAQYAPVHAAAPMHPSNGVAPAVVQRGPIMPGTHIPVGAVTIDDEIPF